MRRQQPGQPTSHLLLGCPWSGGSTVVGQAGPSTGTFLGPRVSTTWVGQHQEASPSSSEKPCPSYLWIQAKQSSLYDLMLGLQGVIGGQEGRG